MSDPATILVRGPNWVGDLVMSTPGFRALRARFPEARITLQLRPGLAALLDGAPWFDEIIPVESHGKGAAALWREGSALRSRRFELGLCLPDSISSALLMRIAGVRRVVGYRRGGRAVLLHHAVRPDPAWGRRRLVARERFVLGLTAALGCPEQGTQLELFTTPDEEAGVAALLGDARPDSPTIALAPGASFGPSKLWPAESFARVGDELAAAGAKLLLVGAPGERAVADAVAAAMRAPVLNLAGEIDLGALKALLRRCQLLVCNDAGARHVAVAFGVPSIVIFGPTSLQKTNLNLERVTVLESRVACRPCYQRACPIDHRCMTRIDPELVLEAARRALGRVPSASSSLARVSSH